MLELCFVNLSCVRELMSLIVGSEVGSGRLLQLIEGSVLVVGADVATAGRNPHQGACSLEVRSQVQGDSETFHLHPN